MKSLSFILFLGLFIMACGNGETADTASSKKADDTSKSTASTTTTPANTKFKITPFSPSTEYADAEITKMLYLNGTWDFDVTGTAYKLGEQTPDAAQKMCANSGKGQHIHLIINNEPYKAKYTSEFSDVPMEDGQYHILAFLSRSYHESIKTKAAHKAELVTIKDNAQSASESISQPMVFYSRPKGTYVGKANTEKVMLDFYLTEIDLSPNGYKVKADINGETHMITKWQPYYIEGLPMGKNSITLTLIDPAGKEVVAPTNPVTRTFELKADELE